ncbi:hypothetical protein ACFYT4_14050 [Streptomyces sp. NPDC004609]|uniref:hypothetical protein n=1 Tax=Streptomyces sp. NPDC004609 TaxID=3364704 RepID=UPI003683E379
MSGDPGRDGAGARRPGGAARSAAEEHAGLLAAADSEPVTVANEFAEIRVVRVRTRNGARLLVESPRSGQWVTLCPLELEALTWQNTATFSAMIGNPFAPLIGEPVEAVEAAGSDDPPGPGAPAEPAEPGVSGVSAESGRGGGDDGAIPGAAPGRSEPASGHPEGGEAG